MNEPKVFDKVYLLCDCNNFFVSCEKLFRPDLANRPVAVLSNNDGVVVSRSYETKKLGIPMGVPVFKIQKEIKKYHITTFSSNFSLYIDISTRVMTTLESYCKDLEVYSVDEAFLSFENITEEEAIQKAFMLKNAIARKIGIPIGVGIARTKTLAKLANHYAKQRPQNKGVFSVLNEANRQRILIDNPIAEIWGIGARMEEHLLEDGYATAYELSKADTGVLQKKYSIVVARTVNELNNIDCIDSSTNPQNQDQIMWSRTFKDRVTSFDDLYEALCNYCADACAKLRSLNRYARKFTIFIRTSYFGDKAKYANDATILLDYPSADTRVYLEATKLLLQSIYKEGYEYMKAGVLLYDFVESRAYQADLFSQTPDKETLDNSDKLMSALDAINKGDKNTVYLGAQNKLTKEEKFNAPKHKSPLYTSSFDDLPEIF